jgi:hypothetical protein
MTVHTIVSATASSTETKARADTAIATTDTKFLRPSSICCSRFLRFTKNSRSDSLLVLFDLFKPSLTPVFSASTAQA